MNLAFSEEQEQLRHALRRMLSERLSSRRLHDAAPGLDRDLWRALAANGFQGARIPEAFDGVGAGYLELCVYAEELGRALAPVPSLGSVFLATEALLTAGSPAQQARWLPKLAAGLAVGAAALDEALDLGAGEGLTGEVPVMLGGADADFAVLRVAGPHRSSLRLVDLDQPGVSRAPIEALDPLSAICRITLDDAHSEPLGSEVAGDALARGLLDKAAVLLAFQQLGGAQAALEQAVAYARERKAFGRAIGSFQAIKHMLADIFVAVELARSNCFHAAWALNTASTDLPLAAAAAHLSAARAYRRAARDNTQVHGGIGFTWEADCHLHYRRAAVLAVSLGEPASWERRLVRQLEQAA